MNAKAQKLLQEAQNKTQKPSFTLPHYDYGFCMGVIDRSMDLDQLYYYQGTPMGEGYIEGWLQMDEALDS